MAGRAGARDVHCPERERERERERGRERERERRRKRGEDGVPRLMPICLT